MEASIVEIKHLQLGERIYSYSLIFTRTEELVITLYDGVVERKSFTVKILSYDLVTGFLAYAIDNRVIQAVVTPGQEYMNVFLQGAYVAMQCKKSYLAAGWRGNF